jgi:hypothetical protein
VESKSFGSKELAGPLRTKRPYIYEEGIGIRGRTDGEPETLHKVELDFLDEKLQYPNKFWTAA